MRLLALAAGLLIAATIAPATADAGPVRAAAAGTATAVAVTGRTAVRGTVVVGRTAAKGTAVVGRTAAGAPSPWPGPRAGASSASRPSSTAAAGLIPSRGASVTGSPHNLATATICRGMLALMSLPGHTPSTLRVAPEPETRTLVKPRARNFCAIDSLSTSRSTELSESVAR